MNFTLVNRILIISPHYPPSNLAAVHRTRLFAQHLPALGWDPVILTVDERYYEEVLDWELHKLIPASQRIITVNAFKVGKSRLIGDIGLRAFFQLRKKALSLLQSEKFDFLYIPIPSFYTALLGPYLHKKTGVNYGIDYIDPWVHEFPGSEKLFSRHWFSTQLAKLLEPIAVKHASLITGVSEGYYLPVLDRNPHLKNKVITAAIPYGGEEGDHEFIKKTLDVRQKMLVNTNSNPLASLTTSDNSVFKFVYAGALLPKAYKPLEEIFKALQHYPKQLNDSTTQQIQIHFIGTAGKVHSLAEQYGLYGNMIIELPDRMPYLDVLKELDQADAIFILGSTEPHYTPSKVYQAVLSQKPILALLHEQSSAVKVLKEANAGIVITMNGEEDIVSLPARFLDGLKQFQEFQQSFNPSKINKAAFEQYSAKAVTALLVEKLDKIVSLSPRLR